MIQRLKVGMAAVFSLPNIINGVDHKLESQIDHKNAKGGLHFLSLQHRQNWVTYVNESHLMRCDPWLPLLNVIYTPKSHGIYTPRCVNVANKHECGNPFPMWVGYICKSPKTNDTST